MSDAQAAFGTTLTWNSNLVAEITNIGGVEISVDEVDVTNHDSVDNYKESIPTLIDAGEVSIEGNFIPSDTNGQIALMNDCNSRTVRAFIITFPAATGTTWSGNAWVKRFKAADAPVDGKLEFSATLRITGKPTLTVTP